MERYVLIYLLAANAVAFLVFGIDKWKAVKGRWRIPEKTLLLFAAAGGSPGAGDSTDFTRADWCWALELAEVVISSGHRLFCCFFAFRK